MPWGKLQLNDGRWIPQLAFGSATRRSESAPSKTVDDIRDAIEAGFLHLDTAQQYGNEQDVGQAIRKSGISRESLWITTKWSDRDKSVRQSCEDSLRKLGVEYVDLYVIHHVPTCNGDIPNAWRQMEEVHALGLAKSIGLSAFGLEEVQQVLASCQVKPAINMILFNANNLTATAPLTRFMSEKGIVVGAYSSLKPLWDGLKNPVLSSVLPEIAKRLGATQDQVLLSWVRAKGAVIFTSSTSRARTRGYIAAGDFDLSADELAAINNASQ